MVRFIGLLFFVLPIVWGDSVLVFVLVCITFCHFYFCYHLDEEKRVGCFALIIIWMSYYCKCNVALPHFAVGWSAVCDCGIS